MRGRVPAHAGDLPLPDVRWIARGVPRRGRPAEPLARGVEEAIRRPLDADAVALRVGRVGQARMGVPRDARRLHCVDRRRRNEHVLGRPTGPRDRRQRPLDQTLRQFTHGQFQRPRHDRSRQHGPPRDSPWDAGHASPLLRQHGGHERRTRCLWSRSGSSRGCFAPARHGVLRTARAASCPRRSRLCPRNGFRRMHGRRQGARQAQTRLSGQFDEPPSHRRSEDGVGRNRPAVRLAAA